MKHGVLNRFSACGWFVCLSADSETQVDLENPVFLSSTSYTYDRLGRQLTAIAAGVSTNLYAYSRYGQLTNEVAQGLCASAPLRETISRATDTLGRSTGFSVAGVGDPSSPYAVTYGYDTYGRFSSVSSSVDSALFAVNYSYLSGSSLISDMTASSGHSWSRSYEPARSLISAVENRFGETVISRFDYVNDELGRRISRADSGQAFDNPAFDVYSYNTRSEVIGAQRNHGTNPADTSRPFGGRGFGYAYDPIGNRTAATETIGGETLLKSYTANALNQYTAIANPDAVGLRGTATNTATVTVNGNAASRDNVASDTVPWHYALLADNANGGDYTFAEIMAVVNPPGTNTPDVVESTSGSVYAPPQAEALTYDDGGNLLNDGRFNYTWNGENRLIKAEEQVCPTNRTLRKVEYAYDHQGRMVWKVVSRRGAEAQSWEDEKATSYLWDAYNIIAETVSSDSATNTTYNVWGLDVDGTLQGAGGVGGLLAVVSPLPLGDGQGEGGTVYLPCYDANGNVMEYVGDDGRIVAHREYDPFGGTVVYTSQSAITNQQSAISFAHWFSTKPWCEVTGLSEYQYRKYSPAMGRWLSRDPIEEEGGENLFVYCNNYPLGSIDILGMSYLDFILNNRTTDFINCMADCINGNDPIESIGQRVLFHISSGMYPKSGVIRLANLLGKTKIADAIRTSCAIPGVSGRTTIPSALSLGLKGNAKHWLRQFGKKMTYVWVAYGLYMAQVEAACAGHCCASRDYDASVGITIPIDIGQLADAAIAAVEAVLNGVDP